MRHLLVLCAIFFGVSYSTTSENNGTFGERVDGSGLIKLGRQHHKARLTLIGMAIQNQQKTIQTLQTAIQNQQTAIQTQETAIQTLDTAIQNLQQIIENQQNTIQTEETAIQTLETAIQNLQQSLENRLNTTQIQQQTIQAQQTAIQKLQNLHPCEEWTPWSPCDSSTLGHFVSQTRTRSCTYPDDADVKSLTTEIDNKLCEGVCPKGYTLTNNGFCIRLNTTSVTHDEAVEHCEQDGGHLIHIDSQRKLDDVKTVLGGYDMHIHIDGRRKDVTSPWEYTYGSKIAFLKWRPGDPTNGVADLCLAFRPNYEDQTNYICSAQVRILCEKVPQ